MATQPISIRVSEIGEFIRFQSCERRFKLGLNNRRLARSVPFSERLFNTLDPVLQEVGRAAEDAWEVALRAEGLRDLTRLSERAPDNRTVPWPEFRQMLEEVAIGESAYAREVQVTGQIGAFEVSGRIDFLVVLWDRGAVRLRLVEAKASRKDRTYHRIQLAAYVLLLKQHLEREPIVIDGQPLELDALEGAVARIDEITNEPQDILERPALSLETEMADCERLLAADGLLMEIAGTNLDDVQFQLDAKCDGCVFSVHCLPESARQRRLELLSIPPGTCRTLRASGVSSIDDLAALDPASERARGIRHSDSFDGDLPQLIALAAARRSTLPRGEDDPDNYQVRALPNAGNGQLPQHQMDGQRLVRVYLQVDYDYSENRIGALSAHVTNSEFEVYTPFDSETRRPSPELVERQAAMGDVLLATAERPTRPIGAAGREVVQYQTQPWTGIGDQDTGAERQLVQQFLFQLVEAISEVAQTDAAPIHFYVYSRSEMTQLIEACTRGGSSLLTHLRELLGSRESLEQLIFSVVQDEVDSRYALGWTGRGLCVATSLSWFGQRYHWTRRVGGAVVELDRIFEQDLFDFKTTLDLNAQGGWAASVQDRAARHRFEIRSRFHDTLTAPYWRALWRVLPEAASIDDARVRAAIGRYRRVAERPGLITAYLIARVQALRWLDERIRFKNNEIAKPPLEIARLHEFELGVDTTSRAAIDFLRLDHHVRMTDWLTAGIKPPSARVQSGRLIPVQEVEADADGILSARFDLEPFGLTAAELSLRSSVDAGSWVRLSPRGGDPERGQTLGQLTRGGITCTVVAVDWQAGTISLDAKFLRGSTYVLQSWKPRPGDSVFDFGSVDESPSDFVAGRVEVRLLCGQGRHVYTWFEPSNPRIPAQAPLPPAREARIEACLSEWQVPHAAVVSPLTADQRDGVLEGLSSRVQLLKGPPGTGKTVTTAASVLARAAVRLRAGDIILVAAHTHLAVDTLIQRIARYAESFRLEALRQGLNPPHVTLARVHSTNPPPDTDGVRNFRCAPCVTQVNGWRAAGVLVIAGTTSGLLKMAQELSLRNPFRQSPDAFQAQVLVVDEASMMVFPHFLSLASLIHPNGEIMLAGDNRQLAPIVAHDWENEDRPPAQFYQPFKSAYEAVLRIVEETTPAPEAARQSPLTFTFRLPPIIRELIARVYRGLDAIELEGLDVPPPAPAAMVGDLRDIWEEENGLLLVLHSERGSRQSNPTEAEIIEAILNARPAHRADSIAVITPHRAQRALLRGRLLGHAEAVSIIDTVERLQGGERPTIIVSGTESDPHAIGVAASFILNLNRSNVAFSRTQERLIVVCAETLLDHIPAELEDYESALLWKSLRNICGRTLVVTEIAGARVQVLAPILREHVAQ